jgi:hypothetical protein
MGLILKGFWREFYISRAFTAYQLSSLILERLKDAYGRFGSRLVVVSDIISLYLDRDVPWSEAMDVFYKLTSYLTKFARENGVIVVATHFPRYRSGRSMYFESVLFGRADVLIRVRDSRRVLRFVLEKHSRYGLGEVEFPSDRVTLERFMGV